MIFNMWAKRGRTNYGKKVITVESLIESGLYLEFGILDQDSINSSHRTQYYIFTQNF